MSKASKRLKSSKAGRVKKLEKTEVKAERKEYLRELEEAARPEEFSISVDKRGRVIPNMVQMAMLGLGAFLVIFAVYIAVNIVMDFVNAAEEGYSVAEYLGDCQPVVACRVADVTEVVAVVLMVITGVVCLKMAVTNRYTGVKVIRVGVVMLAMAIVALAVDFILGRIFW